MANTYTQLFIQFVFSVKGRESLIKEDLRIDREKYITAIVSKQDCKVMAIYCNPDHTHLFVSMTPAISASKLMEQIKSGSSKWINDSKKILGKFAWQKGFGAFSYSKSQVGQVVSYVLNQPNHHKKQSFREEYLLLLNKFDIQYEPEYLFEWYD